MEPLDSLIDLSDTFYFHAHFPLKAQRAGLFISRGSAMHPERVIGSHELIFVKQGDMDMWEDNQHFHLEEGQTLHLWPGRRHGSTKPLPLGLQFYWIHFEIEGQSGKTNGRHADWGSLNSPLTVPLAIQLPQINRIAQPERLERLFRIFLEDQETGVLNPDSASLLTTLMLIEAAQVHEEKPVSADDLNAVAHWAHNYIRMNYDHALTTSKVAEALGYNADYLGRIYRKVYGCTLTEAIHRRRVHVACRYLLDSSMTIEQISQKCGFRDPDYFRRVFRRQMQLSPGTYRAEYSRVHVNSH